MLSFKTCVHSFMVKRILYITALLCAMQVAAFSQAIKTQVQYFNMPSYISIRALQAVNDSTVWFAASHGVYGYTQNAGATWFVDSIKAGTVYPEFRSIAVLNTNTVLVLSIDSPAYLFKTTTKGKKWKQVYSNHTPGIFFDSMKFTDDKNGIAVGDPINNCFKIITTNDGGDTWTETPCTNMENAMEGEACFAASNSCISTIKNRVWFATGGSQARVFYSDDFGKHFTVTSTPIIQGGKMTGVYSLYFMDEYTGIAGGGDYERTDAGITALSITYNRGKTWKPIVADSPFFVSCLLHVKTKTAMQLLVTGHNGTYSMDVTGSNSNVATEITDAMGEKLKFNTLSAPAGGTTVWLAGSKGKIACIKLN